MEDATDTPPAPPSRRAAFFRWATLGLGGLASSVVALPMVGYILGSKREAEHWVPLGRPDEFTEGETRLVHFDNPIRQPWDGMAALTGVYVRRQSEGDRDSGRFLIFAVNCAHLGCPVEWFPQSGLFMCPCHGGVYRSNGDRASGPPTRGLYRCVWRERGGTLEVRAPHYPTLQDTEERPS